jgi:NAD/NADP transhydrogenase beta subunit
MASKAGILLEMLQFLRQRKKYWMIPMVLVFLLLGWVLIAAKGSALAPFIYTLF